MEPIVSSSYNCRLTMKEEDYLESILNTSQAKGYAKARDVAEDLGIAPSSVSEMFCKLNRKGLIVHRKYEGVTLTEPGQMIAEQVRFRHAVLVQFLRILDVPDDIADKDACFMEHELNTVTIQKIKDFVERNK